MKKRILSLFLALVTVFYILPIGSIPAIALGESEETGIEVADMEVGKLYSAEWDMEYEEFIPLKLSEVEGEEDLLEWKGYWDDVPEEDAYVKKANFPQSLIVKRVTEDDLYDVYVTNDDWPEEYNDYRYVGVLELIITGEYTPPADDGYIYGKVGIFCEDAVDGTLTLGKGEKVQAFTELDAEISENAKYQWEMKLEDDRWAIINDCFYSWINISEALITNAKGENATLRCAVTDGTKKYASEELKVAMEPEINAVYAGANGAGSFTEGLKGTNTLNADDQAFQASINYIFVHATRKASAGTDDKVIDGTNAAAPFTHTFYIASDELTATIASPFVMGYTACVLDASGSIEYDGKKYSAKPSHHFDHVNMGSDDSELNITIYYVPNEVEFTVEYYEQNLANDTYSLAGRVRLKGRTDDYVGEDLDEDREGFKSLYYDPKTTISGDEGTIVEIYYDRIYYLVDFILGDGGYGATPYYVRYGTSVMLPKPTKPGYVFVDLWELSLVDEKTLDEWKAEDTVNGTNIAANLSSAYANKNGSSLIVVKNNVEYLANWTASTTTYTVAYWWQDPDPIVDSNGNKTYSYSVWKSVVKSDKSPDAYISSSDIAALERAAPFGKVGYSNEINEKYYFTYNSSRTEADFTSNKNYKSGSGVVVKGDGSTVVNIYYDRNDYEFRFYYAMQNNNGNYVVGGTTYYFGQYAGTNYQNFAYKNLSDELTLIDQYMDSNVYNTKYAANPSTQVGQITALPQLKTDVSDKSIYQLKSQPSNNRSGHSYHYITFTAKYGANISDLWPVDVFESATRSTPNNHSWNSSKAFVSAWNGEYNVYYTQHNSNQTIKGSYQILDYALLWDYGSGYGISNGTPTEESKTVSYLCYWLNGANVGWSVPSLFEYYIYLPSLDGGQTLITYNVYDDYEKNVTNSEMTSDFRAKCIHPSLEGFTKNGEISWERITNPDTSAYRNAYRITFNYTRDVNSFIFHDQYINNYPFDIPYGTDLREYQFVKDGVDIRTNPTYPKSLEVGAKKIAGWFEDEECTISYTFDGTMPDKDVHLYAKWETKTYSVKILNQKNDATALVDTTVEFGSSIKDKEPTYTLPDKNSVFDGWYYEQDGEEYRFDFNTMVIKDDYVIYAKWAKNVQIAYTVRYVTIVDGNEVEIGKPESGYSLAGVSKTFTAKIGDELYDGYKTWYFPNDRYITHLMQEDDASNTITFVYQTATEIKYTIEHIFVSDKFETYLGTGNKTIEYVTNYTMTQGQTFQATITERFDNLVQSDLVKAYLKEKYTVIDKQADSMWNIISAMNADYFVQEMDLTLDENKNVMTFNWVESDATKTYQIVHYLQNKDLSTYSVIYSRSITVQNDNNLDITEVWRDQLGFKRSAFKISGTAQSVDLTQPSVTIKLGAAEKLIMEFYYDRELYTYIVHHYINGTTTKIVDDDVYDGDPATMAKAYYEQEIKVGDVDRDLLSNGYLIANSTTVYTVKSNDFEVRCFYNPMDVYFRYQEAIPGRGSLSRVTYTGKVNTTVDADDASCTATAKTGYRFVGWYLDVNGNQSVDTYATVSADGATITPKTPTSDMANGTYIFYALFEPTTRVFKNSGVTDANQAFVYRIQGLDTGNSYVDVTFVITGNGQVTLAMLPYGKYRVTLLSWSWRYDVPAGWTSNIWELTMSTPDAVVFNYSSVTPTDQWLTDDAAGTVTPTVTP
ncbi:MAG: InlB B-repeat-containing protein [Clostridia bacterium]|nr:InlB B-repeat-containing protein [Clostridia bacterium]